MNSINDGFSHSHQSVNIEFDPKRLLSLGFSPNEINALDFMLKNNLTISTNNMARLNIQNYDNQQRIRYMYGICEGRYQINTDEELVKHLRKINNRMPRIGMNNLKTSKVSSVPMAAIVGNIRQQPYTIWNSKNYKGTGKLYVVRKISATNITIETSRKPQLSYKAPKEIDGIFKIEEILKNGRILISFNKNYCKLCNRFIIAASLRKPEFHLGMYKIICVEGTTVYVYATSMGTRGTVRYNMQTQRVYDYGILPEDIKPKLLKTAKEISSNVKGVKHDFIAATADYIILPQDEKPEEEETDIE